MLTGSAFMICCVTSSELLRYAINRQGEADTSGIKKYKDKVGA